jgi:hypothetical protein
MARQPRPAPRMPDASAPGAINPIATAYFRAAEEEPDATPEAASAGAGHSAPRLDARNVAARVDVDSAASIDAVIELLAEAGLVPERPRALLEAADEDPRSARLQVLRALMTFLLHHDETVYLARSRELAFLANTLLAGCSVQSRPFTPREASDAAACICNLGLECWPARWPGATSQRASPPGEPPRDPGTAMAPDGLLVEHDLVSAFEVGWSVLYEDVSLFVADQLVATLADLDCADADSRHGIRALRRTLAEQREAGTPWLARGAADVLAMHDTIAWISVLGLLDECPILPEALTAVLERRTTAVSPTAFEFISTAAQIADVRLFMRALPGVLSG